MKEPWLPRIIYSTAVFMVCCPLFIQAEERETSSAVISSEMSSPPAESGIIEAGSETESIANGETSGVDPEQSDGEQYKDYYVLVTSDDGVSLHQDASNSSPLSINIPIPKGTLLHITEEKQDAEGKIWGFTQYADLNSGYFWTGAASAVQISTGKEQAEKRMKNGNAWGDSFVPVDGAGTPITFNSIPEEAVEEAESRQNEESIQPETDADTEETDAADGAVSNGNDQQQSGDDNNTDENTVNIASDVPINKKGKFSIATFGFGFLSAIGLEAVIAGLMILSRKFRGKSSGKFRFKIGRKKKSSYQNI
ncbi:hypothetical protein ACTNEN_02485 [Oribacterium sp. HCP28S3_H8]|uniref:hypothetical protein n=1 Tax=Oribacterium sp. HCP28S3_H8 TaxID=3438945 RepID=UPI003F8A1CF9